MVDRSTLRALVASRVDTREDGQRTLACADAFALAEAHDVDLLAIAKVCNQDDVKIVRCQLGCFR